MSEDRLLLTVAFVAVAVSVLAAGFTYFSIADLTAKISGFATGEANLSVETLAQINFTDDSINFGSGIVTGGQSSAFLDTTTGTIVNGNWTFDNTGLALQNIGNVNVSINLSSSAAAAAFLGGTSPSFQWNVSESEAGSCLLSNGTVTASEEAFHEKLDIFVDVNASATDAEFCELFPSTDTYDSLRIDVNLTVPSDAITGARGAIITATAVACGCP